MIFAAVISCVAIGVFAPPEGAFDRVEYNQSVLESIWGAQSATIPLLPIEGEAPDSRAPQEPPRFDDPISVLAFVLSRSPENPIVYPTEGYYYFGFYLGERRISGNIRFSDINDGGLSVGYFDALEPSRMQVGLFRSGDSDRVQFAVESTGLVRVSVDGRTTRRFRVVDPEALPTPGWTIDGDMELLSSVIDESGVPFALLYHKPSSSFLFALHDRLPPGDRFVPVEGHERYLIGLRSRFVFYREEDGPGYLVGVLERSIRDNSWFDGPFDQVPPRLDIGERLETAYPYVRERGGIDRHGQFIKLEGQRVAISPYQTYASLDRLITRLETFVVGHNDPLAGVLAMTHESKRDFHLQIDPDNTVGEMLKSLSAGWPANHWARVSLQWPRDHATPTSADWPANHMMQSSTNSR